MGILQKINRTEIISLEKEEEWFVIIDESSEKIFQMKEKLIKRRVRFSKYSFQFVSSCLSYGN